MDTSRIDHAQTDGSFNSIEETVTKFNSKSHITKTRLKKLHTIRIQGSKL